MYICSSTNIWKKTYCNKKCRITPWQEKKIKTLILI